MAEESEPDLFADARSPPPRALTRLSPLVRRLVAPNASPYTFNGTCTYILGDGAVAVLDPGPADEGHLAGDPGGGRGRAGRDDPHHPYPSRPQPLGAGAPRQATGARIVGAAPFAPKGDGTSGLDSSHDRDYAPDAVLSDGERLHGSGFTLETVATPGHCANHLCFLASRGARALFRRPCDGVVDVGRRAAGRLDGGLHGFARQSAGARGRRSTGRATAGRSSSRSAMCARSPIIAASGKPRSWPRWTAAPKPSPSWSPRSMSASSPRWSAPPAFRLSPISKIFAGARGR